MNQSKLEANTCKLWQAREYAGEQVTIGLGLNTIKLEFRKAAPYNSKTPLYI